MAENYQFPKLLAFLQLFYPELYAGLRAYSGKADIVEANLICSNNTQSYQAIVFSEDVAKEGELFEVCVGKNTIAPYSWDWRWVFALKILFEGNEIFPLKFKQKIIALPTGKYPLTEAFFNIIENDFKAILDEVQNRSIIKQESLRESYAKFTLSIII